MVVGPTARSASAGFVAAPLAAISAPTNFVALAPCRVVDTRNASGPFGGPSYIAGTTRSFAVPSGPCTGIPAAAAYSLNFTITNYDASLGANGFITAFPTGTTRPLVSTLNFGNGDGAIANAAIVPANASGSIDVYSSGGTNLIIDINGYFLSNESGSVVGAGPSFVGLTTLGTPLKIMTISISCPSAGKVTVASSGYVNLSHTTGTDDNLAVQIFDNAAGTPATMFTAGSSSFVIPSALPSSSSYRYPFSAVTQFAVSGPSTFTAALWAEQFTGASVTSTDIAHPIMVATFEGN